MADRSARRRYLLQQSDHYCRQARCIALPGRCATAPRKIERRASRRIPKASGSPEGWIHLSLPRHRPRQDGRTLGSIAITGLLTRAGIPVRATQSRFLSWDDFRSKNLILLGHDEANRWLDPLLSKLPLRLARGGVDKPRRVVNTQPRPGERAEYWPNQSTSSERRPEDYALISVINGIDDRHRLLLINGVNTEGTQIAEEFLTDPVSMRRLLATLHENAPKHEGPWRFQLVLHADVRDNVPTKVDIIVVASYSGQRSAVSFWSTEFSMRLNSFGIRLRGLIGRQIGAVADS